MSASYGELIELDVSRELGNYFNDAIVIHALLNRAGINARIRSMDWATQLKRYWQRDYQLSLFSYSGRASAPLMYSVFVCDVSASEMSELRLQILEVMCLD